MQLYFNGDSFVAGVELGDDILPDYPGLLPWHHHFTKEIPAHAKNREWRQKTHTDPALNQLRNKNSQRIYQLELERAFPNKVAKLTGAMHINHALGGSSMDRIARLTLVDLYKLKKQYPSERIVAFIGTTHPCRSEIANTSLDGTELHGIPQDWICVSPTYVQPGRGEHVDAVLRYKILYETNYHMLVNFYRNIILVNDFCAVNNIDLHWIATHDNIIKDSVVEPEFAERDSLVILRDYANMKYTLDMKDFLDKAGTENVICPGGHFGENIHELVANEIVRILE